MNAGLINKQVQITYSKSHFVYVHFVPVHMPITPYLEQIFWSEAAVAAQPGPLQPQGHFQERHQRVASLSLSRLNI